MTRYVGFIRGVNVVGSNSLAMADLRKLCVGAGFLRVETYIASGNVVFDSRAGAKRVKAALEKCLLAHMSKPVSVMVRDASEMQAVLESNPFPDAPGSFVFAFFLDAPPPADALERVTRVNGERMKLGKREIYVHYPSGMGQSKLTLPAAKIATARNMNTVAALARMAAG